MESPMRSRSSTEPRPKCLPLDLLEWGLLALVLISAAAYGIIHLCAGS